MIVVMSIFHRSRNTAASFRIHCENPHRGDGKMYFLLARNWFCSLLLFPPLCGRKLNCTVCLSVSFLIWNSCLLPHLFFANFRASNLQYQGELEEGSWSACKMSKANRDLAISNRTNLLRNKAHSVRETTPRRTRGMYREITEELSFLVSDFK